MSREPTDQQRQLQASCPHQNWLEIDLSQHEYYVRRAYLNPHETGFVSYPEPGETRPFNRPTPALKRSWTLAKEYQDQGYKVIKDMQWGVHQLSKPGDRTFYLFIEFQEKNRRSGLASSVAASQETSDLPIPSSNYFPTSVRLETRQLKVLKAVAELRDQSVSSLLEEMIAAALDGREMFDPDLRRSITQLKQIYGLREEPAVDDDTE